MHVLTQIDKNKEAVKIKELQFTWNKDQNSILDIPSLTIQTGEHVFIKGPSGSGKSTLLSLLTGIHTPSTGEIYLLGKNITHLTSYQRDQFRADHIGYIFQQLNLLPHLSVLDNVLLPCYFSKKRRQNLSSSPVPSAKQLLSNLHISNHDMKKKVNQLSVGQQQRVAAARAFIGSPDLILADEPTSSLDIDNRDDFLALLKEQAVQHKATLIFVSHDPFLEKTFHRIIDLPTLNQVHIQ